MIKATDVNSAMLQQAAEELEIGVPIRAWEVQDGALVLHLAYGRAARWRGPGDGRRQPEVAAAPAGKPWKFVEENRKDDPPALPGGKLGRKTRQQLLNVALDWGFQSTSDYVSKAELVEAVTWLRNGLVDEGD